MTNGFNDAELIARLRDGCNLQQRDGERAAERIESLRAQLAEANARADNYEGFYTMAILAHLIDRHARLAPTVTTGWPTEEGEGSIIVGNVKGDSHE